jgi:hypothetical protein
MLDAVGVDGKREKAKSERKLRHMTVSDTRVAPLGRAGALFGIELVGIG